MGPFAVDPDEKYLIVSIRDSTSLNPDFYISYYKGNDWSIPKKLKGGINTPETEAFPYITPDGKYFIFTRAFSQFYIIPTSQIID